MTTLADLRGRLRVLLNDNTAGGYLWSDMMLNLVLGDAVRSYSRSCPLERTASITTIAGKDEYDLPSDCVKVMRVECEAYGHMPLQEGGDAFGEGYGLYGGKLMLLPGGLETGLMVLVRYLSLHSIPVLDQDVLTVPAGDEDLVLAFAAARAIESLVVDEAKRERFEARYGQNSSVAAEFYRRRYETGVRERVRVVRAGRLVAV